MSNYDFQRQSMDDAIDGAVRDIMHVDPRPGLRRRVLAKLNAPAQRIWWAPRLFVPVGVFAALLLAVVLTRDGGELQPAPETQVARNPTPSVSAPVAGVPRLPPSVQVSRPAAPATRPRQAATSEAIFGPRRNRVSAASLAEPVVVSDAEAAATPEGLAPLTLPAIQIPLLQLQPLAPRR